MKAWQILSMAALTLLSVFVLSLGWAFLGEAPTSLAAAGRTAVPLWQQAAAATLVATLALVAPVAMLLRQAADRAAPPVETSEGDEDAQALPEFAQDAIVSIDAEDRILLWNPAAEVMFGYSSDEMYGQSLSKIIPQRYRRSHADGLARVNAGGEHHIIGRTVELAGLRESGEEFPLELSLSTWTAGTERHYGAIIRDITERVRAQESLRRSEEQLRKLVETAPDAVVVIEAGGKIVAWNPGAQQLFGYGVSEAIGMDVTALMPERYRQAHREGLQRLGHGGEGRILGRTVELHGLHKDGGEFALQLSLGTWSAGQSSFFSAIIRPSPQKGVGDK